MTDKLPSFLRHSGWFASSDCLDTLNIIGCGATGSHIALLAAKMGFMNFSLWDADKVEAHNLPNQTYNPQHIGMNKVDALEAVLQEFNPEIIVKTNNKFFTKETATDISGPLILTTDTMSSRKEIFEIFKYNYDIDYVFETRLGFDYGEFHVIDNMNDQILEKWSKLLVNDEDIEEAPCNQRICTTLVNLISSYVVHTICAKYVAESKEEEWKYKYRTMFELTPELKIYTLN